MFSLLCIIGAAQGLLLFVFLLLKKDRLINLPIIIYVLITSVELVFQYIYSEKLIFQFPHLLYLTEPFSMLGGVLIYAYVRNIFSGRFVSRKTDLLLFIPFLLYLGYYFPSYFQSAEDKIFDITAFYSNGISWNENLTEWFFEVMVTLPFLFVSLKKLNTFHASIKNSFSNISKLNYLVVKKLIYFAILLYLFEFALVLLLFFEVGVADILNNLVYVLSTIIVYVIGYDALVKRHTELVNIAVPEFVIAKTDFSLSKLELKPDDKERIKYEKNSLTFSKIDEITKKITTIIATEKPYKNLELRLTDFASMVSEHPNNVSQVINEVYGRNFYDFINFYRVEEAKNLLRSPKYKHFTIVAIGFEVGFNSKSAFYSAFKKFADTTPSQFQKIQIVE